MQTRRRSRNFGQSGGASDTGLIGRYPVSKHLGEAREGAVRIPGAARAKSPTCQQKTKAASTGLEQRALAEVW